MEVAFARLHGARDVFVDLRFGGMTDRAIARHGLGVTGHEATESAIDAVLAVYLAHLRETLPGSLGFRVLAGGARAANRAREAGAAVGIGSGNIRGGAQLKLSCAGLEHLFDFGGYGCDSEARDQVLRMGRDRGAAKLGWDPNACEVVIVGDTPRDVLAAKAIGARCLGVTTGRFDAAALVGADLVASSLEDEEALRFLER